MKKRYILGFVLSMVFMYLAFKSVNVSEFVEIFSNINYLYSIPVVASSLIGFIFRALRWKYILEPVKVIKISKLFSATMIGFMANNILPVRLGEIVRAYSIGKMENISKSSSFATIVAERVLDLLFIMFVFLALLFLFPFTVTFPEEIIRYSYFLILFAFVFLFFLLFILWKRKFVLNIVEKILSSFSKNISSRIHRIINSFIKGLDFFNNTRHFITIILYTILMWLFYMLSFSFALLAFDFFNNSIQTFFLLGVVLIVLASVGMMIPSAPGAIGTFHSFCIWGILIIGIADKNQAAAYAVFVHGLDYISITTVGLFFLFKENLHFAEMNLKDEKSNEEND